MANETPTFKIEDAQLVWRNFAGKETKFKPEGTRTFSVVLPHDLADQMAKDGWNAKCKPADPNDPENQDEFCFIEVTVGFKVKPPTIVCLTDTSRTRLDESTVEMLDWADIRTVDLIVRAYQWEVGASSGLKAYLQSMYVTIEEDDLAKKYAVREDV